MAEDILIARERDHVLTLTLNRPEARNALSTDLIAALDAAFAGAGARRELRAIVLTGAGDKAFCAGADLKPRAKTFGFDYAEPTSPLANLLRTARAVTVPVIARVNGHCLAGGMGLLAICDMVVASSTARFGLPEVKVGLFPLQVGALLHSIIPPRRFREMCFTGESFTAAEALDFGLVNYVVEPSELDAKTAWLVGRVVGNSPAAIRRGKYALNAIADMTTEQALAYMEGQIGLVPMTEDAREGMAAFSEKRPPVWTGR